MLPSPPIGIPDRLAGDARRLRRRQRQAIEALQRRGFEEVAVPMLERADVFCTAESVRFVDREGDLLGLRADFTGPLARVVATRLSGVPDLRLCYRGTLFRDGARRELQQAGFEHFGDGSVEEDIQAILTAVEVARALGYEARVSVSMAEADPQRLATVLDALEGKIPVQVDLAEQAFSYYTGIVFSLYAEGVPRRLGGGGRYDGLVGRFGAQRPAIGASFDLDSEPQRAQGRLTVALPKGRIRKGVLAALGEHGPADLTGRELRVHGPDLDFLLVKDPDIPTYVELGAAQAGVVGLDQLQQQDRDVLEVCRTELGRCRMCLCARPGTDLRSLASQGSLRIATKYPRAARRALQERGYVADIIPLEGSVELAVVAGLADAIVDLVETGATLEANGLVELETLFESTAVLIVNKAAWRLRRAELERLVGWMESS